MHTLNLYIILLAVTFLSLLGVYRYPKLRVVSDRVSLFFTCLFLCLTYTHINCLHFEIPSGDTPMSFPYRWHYCFSIIFLSTLLFFTIKVILPSFHVFIHPICYYTSSTSNYSFPSPHTSHLIQHFTYFYNHLSYNFFRVFHYTITLSHYVSAKNISLTISQCIFIKFLRYFCLSVHMSHIFFSHYSLPSKVSDFTSFFLLYISFYSCVSCSYVFLSFTIFLLYFH